MTHERDFENPDVPHVPDWDTVALSDHHDTGNIIFFDVSCKVCGQSGSFHMKVEEDADKVVWV